MTEFDAARVRRLLASSDEEERRRALAEIPEEWNPGALAVLMDALGDESWRVRKDAVARVARWPDREGAVPMLIATLADDSNVGLRNAAVEALAQIGGPSVGPLVTALQAGGEHRKFLVDALGAIGDPGGVPALIRCLDDEDENVRAAAAEALGRIGGESVADALRRRLGGADLLGRLAALDALNRLEARVELSVLIPLLGQPVLRHAAVQALGWAGDLQALPYLLAALTDKGRSAREAAALALRALHATQATHDGRLRVEASVRALPAAVPGLLSALSAEDVAVRRAAATLLGWGRWPEALPQLCAALADDEIHATCARAIIAYGPPAVTLLVELAREAAQELRSEIFALFPRLGSAAADARVAALLCRALEDEDPSAAAAAARALGEVGGKDSVAALFHAVSRGDDPAVPQAAAQALAKLSGRYVDEVRMLVAAQGIHGQTGVYLCRIVGAVGRAEDGPLLLAALRDDDPALRRAAADAISSLPAAPETREALVYTLADEDVRVRAAAATALGELADVHAVPALMGATGDEEETVRSAAARALGILGDGRAAPLLRELAKSGTPALVVHALEALSRLMPSAPDPADEQLLEETLGRRDPEVVKAAVRALAVRPGPRATQALRRALDHPRWDVRRLAAQALGGRPDAEARAALRSRAGLETDPLVRETIEHALQGSS